MPTTLRPDGPEEALPGGGRTRRYRVWANGLAVGAVRATARAYGQGFAGEITELEITGGRRRGRGTVAVLAVEEVLRAWGCSRVDVTVPAEAAAALQLVTGLGYRERMRNMAKVLPPVVDELPAGLTERPIGAADFPQWVAATKEGYIRSLCDSGLSEPQARVMADGSTRAMLPQGAATPEAVLRYLMPQTPHDAKPLGTLWVQLHGRTLPDGSPLAWVNSVEVAEGNRGRGYGRALMLVAERACVAAGVRNLGLNVFADNEVAAGLYTSLGYTITQRILGKELLPG